MLGLATVLPVVMVIVDMTVVNVSLPHMMGSLGATSDQISWVLTSYIVAEAITIPLAGYLSGRFGRKRLMMGSIAIFIVASALCGQASSLEEMVIFRLIQGAAGAAVIPVSQAILASAFPREKLQTAMACWGIGIMMGPVLGPTLGGFITETLDWRWVFYINIPFGGLSLLLMAAALPASEARKMSIDWWGVALLGIGMASLQYVFDKGNEEDWFASHLIVIGAFVCFACIAGYALRAQGRSDNVVDVTLLKNRNLAASLIIITFFGFGMFGSVFLEPLLLQRVYGYPTDLAGLMLSPRGLASACGMATVAILSGKADMRWVIGCGLCICAVSTYLLSQMGTALHPPHFILILAIQGYGTGLFFVPVSSLALQDLGKDHRDQGSVIFNIARSLGSSIGISVATYLYITDAASSHAVLSGKINPYNPAWLNSPLASHGITDPGALVQAARVINQQATVMASNATFMVMTMSFILLVPLLLLIRKPDPHAALSMEH